MSDSGHPTRRDVVLRAGLDLGIAEYGARPGQSGDVRTSFLAVPEEQASRQCQQDSSRLAKGVRKTTKGLRHQCAAGELTTPQCPVLMHLVRVAPMIRQDFDRRSSGMVMATQSRRPPRLRGRRLRASPSGCCLDTSLVDPAGSRASSTSPTRVQGLEL